MITELVESINKRNTTEAGKGVRFALRASITLNTDRGQEEALKNSAVGALDGTEEINETRAENGLELCLKLAAKVGTDQGRSTQDHVGSLVETALKEGTVRFREARTKAKAWTLPRQGRKVAKGEGQKMRAQIMIQIRKLKSITLAPEQKEEKVFTKMKCRRGKLLTPVQVNLETRHFQE